MNSSVAASTRSQGAIFVKNQSPGTETGARAAFFSEEYVNEWVVGIEDMTPLVRKIHGLLKSGSADKARRLLPPERVYEVKGEVAKRLGMAG